MFSLLEVFCVFRMLLVLESVCLNCFNVLLHNKKLCKWFKRTGDREELGYRGKEKLFPAFGTRIKILKPREWFSAMTEHTEFGFVHELVKT